MRDGIGALTQHAVGLTLAGLAGVVACTSLLGWIIDLPQLASFGISGFACWPWTIVGYLLLTLAMIGAMLGRAWARPVAAAAILLVVIFFFETLVGIDRGIDQLFFPGVLGRMNVPHAGRPAANTSLSILLLGLSIVIGQWRGARFDAVASLLAAMTISLGLYSAIVLLWLDDRGPGAPLLLAPLPASICAVILATTCLWWKREDSWAGLISARRLAQPLGWLVLPLLLVLPTVPILLERWASRMLGTTPSDAGLIAMAASALILGAVLLFASNRMARQQAALGNLAAALDSAAIALVREDGTIVHWTRGCTEMYGWSAAEAVDRNKFDLLQSAAGDPAPQASLGQDGESEFVAQSRDGRTIHILERRRALPAGRDGVLVALKFLDISARVRAEQDLRASEQRLAIAVEAHEVGVFEWDVASGRLSWSPGSEQRLGLKPGMLDSFEAWRERVDPEDVASVLATIDSAVADHLDRFTFTYRFMGGIGPVRVIEGAARCIYDPSGNLLRTVGSIVDVTDRNTREAEMRLSSVIETVPDATIVIDDRGIVRSFSRAAEATFGLTADEVIGRNVKMLMPEGLASRHDAAIADYLDTGDRKVIGKTRELTARRADGSLFPIELNVGEARIGEQRIFTGIVRDVSARVREEQRLAELNAELAHISRQRAMSELAADLAHELNQPLSATANFLATARMLTDQGASGERTTELLSMAEEQIQRSGDIIRRLRDFVAKRDVERRPESLELVVQDAVALVLLGSSQFDIDLGYDLDPAADCIFVDRVQIQQVLVNLLRNAVEAIRSTPDGTRRIDIRSRAAADGMVEISLADTGPGIPDTFAEQLYARFSTTKTGAGMGIGLSISRRIIEAHGGTLTARNRPEGGAIVEFTLPVFEGIADDT